MQRARWSIFGLAMTAVFAVSFPVDAMFSYGWKERMSKGAEAWDSSDEQCWEVPNYIRRVREIENRLASGNNNTATMWHYTARHANMMRYERKIYAIYRKGKRRAHPVSGRCESFFSFSIEVHGRTHRD